MKDAGAEKNSKFVAKLPTHIGDEKLKGRLALPTSAELIGRLLAGAGFSPSADVLARLLHGEKSGSAPLLVRPEAKSASSVRSVGDIGRLVREERLRRKLSQQAFADLAGVGRRFLSELENGKPTLEVGKVLHVAAVAGIDLVAQKT